MTVTIEPLAIGSLTGPRVYLFVRRVGKHLDVEEAPDDVTTETEAVAFAARWWRVREGDVVVKAAEIIEIVEPD